MSKDKRDKKFVRDSEFSDEQSYKKQRRFDYKKYKEELTLDELEDDYDDRTA